MAISFATSAIYEIEKYKAGVELIKEWSKNQRNFPLSKVVQVYNFIKGTNEKPSGCGSCNSKFLVGIKNYVKYAELYFQRKGIDYDTVETEEVIPNPTEELIEEGRYIDNIEVVHIETIKIEKDGETKEITANKLDWYLKREWKVLS